MYKGKSEFELIADYLDESFINLFFSSELVTAENLISFDSVFSMSLIPFTGE
jgi:hypothetical protein